VCYSKVVLNSQLRVKIVPKQAVGLEVPSAHQALLAGGAVWYCDADAEVDEALLEELASASAQQRCRVDLPPRVQGSVGQPQPLQVDDVGCSQWVGAEFRMCAKGLPAGDIAIFGQGSAFYAQTLDSTALIGGSGCRQTAFFHFQEWKKLWETSAEHAQIDPLRPSETLGLASSQLAFSITTGGFRRISRT